MIADFNSISSLSRYLREIRAYPMLSPEEERDLAERWQRSGDEAALDRLVGSHLRLVVKLAKRARGYGLPLTDLIAEGNIGLIEAARKFDPERGNRFSTYAIWWIRAAIQRYVLDNASIVRLGTTAGQKKLFFNLRRLKAARGEFDDDTISEEAVDSVAHVLGVRRDEVVDMNARLARNHYSLNAAVSEDGQIDWQDTLVDESPDQEEQLIDEDQTAWRRVLLRDGLAQLSDRERDILVRRRIDEDHRTLADLSKKYGVSRERIRQIEVAAYGKLRQAMLEAAA